MGALLGAVEIQWSPTMRIGVPRIRLHDLRHTSATLMLANGEHPKIVQERLGRSDVSMTLNRYSHVTMDLQRDVANCLDALIGEHRYKDGIAASSFSLT